MTEAINLSAVAHLLHAWHQLRPGLIALGVSPQDLDEYEALRLEADHALQALTRADALMTQVSARMTAFTQRLQTAYPTAPPP